MCKPSDKILSPKVDFVFKRIFGNEQHLEVLISFLNAVLSPKDIIKSVVLNNTNVEKNYIEDKFSILDIKATTDTGEIVNIEMQMKNEYNMDKRTLYHWSKMYSEQMGEGDSYSQLSRTICINLLNFKYLKEKEYHNIFRVKNVETNEELTDVLEIHFIELLKLKIDEKSKYKNMLEKWLDFINNPTKFMTFSEHEKEIEIAVKSLSIMSLGKEERQLYEKNYTAILEYNNALDKGRAEGREEERIKLVENLLDILDDETISKTTELSLDIIKNLRRKNNIKGEM